MNELYGLEDMRGVLFFVLLVAAPLSLMLTLVLIGRYRRAVRRGMMRISVDAPKRHAELHPAPPGMHAPVVEVGPVDSSEMTRALNARERSRAAVYSVAGVAGSLCMTWIYFWINGIEVLPVRFGVFSYLFAWPAFLALAWFDLSLRFRVLAMTGYFLTPLLFPLTYFDFISVWGTYMGIPSALLLFFALPRFRVVGPIVFIAIFFAAWGALSGMFSFAQAYFALGLDLGTEVPVWIGLLTCVVFLLPAWWLLRGVADLYRMRWFSDWQLGVDAWWLLFTLWMGILLTIEGGGLAWSALAQFVVYRVLVVLGLRSIVRGESRPRTLLLLRVFGRPEQSRSLFSRLDLRWRDLGPIKLIVSADLAHQTLEVQELLEYLSGRLERRFHKAGERVHLDPNALVPDPDHRFRAQDFLCYADSWREVLVDLLDNCDAIIMDLRGFQARNRGCAFELSQIARRLPEKQFIGLIDSSTDHRALQETLDAAWAGMTSGPAGARGFRLLQFAPRTPVDNVLALVSPN